MRPRLSGAAGLEKGIGRDSPFGSRPGAKEGECASSFESLFLPLHSGEIGYNNNCRKNTYRETSVTSQEFWYPSHQHGRSRRDIHPISSYATGRPAAAGHRAFRRVRRNRMNIAPRRTMLMGGYQNSCDVSLYVCFCPSPQYDQFCLFSGF